MCLQESRATLDEEQLAQMANSLISAMDRDRDGLLTLAEFVSGIQTAFPGMGMLKLDPLTPAHSSLTLNVPESTDSRAEGLPSRASRRGLSSLRQRYTSFSNAVRKQVGARVFRVLIAGGCPRSALTFAVISCVPIRFPSAGILAWRQDGTGSGTILGMYSACCSSCPCLPRRSTSPRSLSASSKG